MRRQRSAACLVCGCVLAAVAAHAAAASSIVRGAGPDTIAKYVPSSGKFACFDGSKVIDFSQINDNFCDCHDSSDEPGTSACPNGMFYCKNRGHEAKFLPTSFVDDGICDCCDGSDELSGCANTCIEKNSAKREALRQAIDEYKASLARKGQYASSVAGVRANIKQRSKAIDGDIAKAEQELDRLTAERKRVEEETNTQREEHKAEQARLAEARKAEAAAKKQQAAQEAAAADAKAAADAAGTGDAGGEQQQQEDGGKGEQEETAEERGRRIASQWTNDPAAAAAPGPDAAASEKDVNEGESYLSRVYNKAKDSVGKLVANKDAAAAGTDDEFDRPDGLPHVPDEADDDEAWGAQDDPDYVPFDETPVRRAVADAEAAERRLGQLKAEKERVMRQVEYELDDAWAGLLDKCLETREPQFTYKFCFYDRAMQVDNGGGHETSLGVWKGFNKDGTEAVFDGGDYCHKSPARSLRVALQCGPEERAWGASEPTTCAYTVQASSPAACKPETLKELEAKLAELLAEEAALAQEIAAEEKERQAQLAAMRAKQGPHDEL